MKNKFQFVLPFFIFYFVALNGAYGEQMTFNSVGIESLEKERAYTNQPMTADENDGDTSTDDVTTDQPTLTPTYPQTDSPTTCPTAYTTVAPVTPPPTFRSHPTASPTIAPSQVPTLAPTYFPTLYPTARPTLRPISPAPTTEPTVNKALAELRYPKYFSSTADTVLLSLGVVVFLAWAAIGGLYAYRRFGWGGRISEDRQHLVGTKAPKRKRIKKFEDYWEEESEDNTSKKFPTRAAAAASSLSTFEDYWDESVDFSSHSSDALNFSRGI